MKRRYAGLFCGLAVGLLATLGWRSYTRRRVQERESCFGGLDDPDIAEGFNRMARLPQMRLMRWLVARRAVGYASKGQAVDLGCGPGYLVLELARQSADLHLTGVDLSAEMIAEAEERTRRSSMTHRVKFKKGDVTALPFPSHSLHLVVSTLSLHHWAEPEAVLNEVHRVLRRGGSFLIFDLRRDMTPPFYLLLWFVTHFAVPAALRRAREPLGSRDASYTPAEARRLAEQACLTGCTVTAGPFWLTIEGTAD